MTIESNSSPRCARLFNRVMLYTERSAPKEYGEHARDINDALAKSAGASR